MKFLTKKKNQSQYNYVWKRKDFHRFEVTDMKQPPKRTLKPNGTDCPLRKSAESRYRRSLSLPYKLPLKTRAALAPSPQIPF